jgi:RNA polymerase sigma factor (sigma-70 family)
MSEKDGLTERFEESRGHLHAVAYRMLGSASEAEDAVQETWLRLHRTDTAGVANLGGWLTTVTARVCLDMLRSRKSRREEPLEPGAPEPADGIDPAEEALLAHSVGLALLVVLEELSPAERVSFVLHDLFDLPFEEIAPIVGRTQEAARQLASRARRRVRGAPPPASADLGQQRAAVDAFLAASRAGDLPRLVTMLDPGVVFRADSAAMRGRPALEVRGAETVAKMYSGRAQGAGTGLLDGAVGIVVAPLGRLMMVIRVTLAAGRITELDVIADPEKLREIEITAL